MILLIGGQPKQLDVDRVLREAEHGSTENLVSVLESIEAFCIGVGEGTVKGTLYDLRELVRLSKGLHFEAKWRVLKRDLKIYMEVR